MRRPVTRWVAGVTAVVLGGGLAACGDDHRAHPVAYGDPVSQPSFGRLVASVRKHTGGTTAYELVGFVDRYGQYEVTAGPADHRTILRFHYTWSTLELTSGDGMYYDDPDEAPPSFDLARLDVPALQRVHRAAWDAADRPVQETSLTVAAGEDGSWIHVVVQGTDDSTYHLDARMDGSVVDQGEGGQLAD